MNQKYSLNGPSVLKGKLKEVQNIIVMLHGYGSNGDDLIQISEFLKEDSLNTLYTAPNAPYKYNQFSNAFKWFEVYPDGIPIDQAGPEQQAKTEKEFKESCRLIKDYIYQLSEKHKIELKNIFLLGFSQGSMMSLEVGTELEKPIAGIISLSGRIYTENFKSKSRTKVPILVIHGENDDIIKSHRFYETCKILNECGYNIEKHLLQNLGHTISNDVIQITKKFIRLYK